MLLPRDYNHIFWADGKHDPALIILQVIQFLRRYGEEHMPIMLADREIELDVDVIRTALLDWGNEDGVAVGLRSKSDIALRITTNTKEYQNVLFHDTLRIGFNANHVCGPKATFTLKHLEQIFLFCVEMFNPFYGFCRKSGEINHSSKMQQLNREVDVRKLPVAIEWFNYFNPDWVSRLGGPERLLAAPALHVDTVSPTNGVILILQEAPFDYLDPVHLENRNSVEEYLQLAQLQQVYRR